MTACGILSCSFILIFVHRDRYGHSVASWPVLWKKVFTEVEGEAFADKVVVQAELRERLSPAIFGAKRQHYMLYWSVRIV